MSCLDILCVSYFKERDDFICMIEKGLMLDKRDFAKKGYEIDEDQLPRNPRKTAFSSGRGKQNIDVIMLDNDSDKNTEIKGEAIVLGDDAHNFDAVMEERRDDEELEECTRDDLIPLVGIQLGGIAIGDENSEELARARHQATPQKLFNNQSSPFQLEEEIRLTQPSPKLPSNPSRTQKGKRPGVN
jgi:hypothetical protein